MKNKWIMIVMISVLFCSPLWAEEKEGFVYDDNSKRDPFWPLVSIAGVVNNYESDFLVSDLNLEGIITGTGGESNIAIINGRIVKEQDQLGQFWIMKIFAEKVIIKSKKETFEMKLKKED